MLEKFYYLQVNNGAIVPKMRNTFVAILLTLFAGGNLFAQGIDSLFNQARSYAFNGGRNEARVILRNILTKSPQYSEARILLGRTYSWDGKRDSARLEFKHVLNYDSLNTDAWSALVDVEMWDDKHETALLYTENSLRLVPSSKTLRIKRINALMSLKRCGEAEEELARVRASDSSCIECSAIKRSILNSCANKMVAAGSNVDFFSNTYGTAIYNFVQFGYRTTNNNYIIRMNQSSRFGTTGFQPEIDMYPSLGKKTYGYVNYGFTTYDLFPRHRIGLEIYRSLPRSFEASLGGRYMNFKSSEVLIYTASLTKYKGNYAFIGRIFITPDKRSFSRSGIINVRRYFKDADTYFGLTFSAGASPDQRSFLTTSGIDSTGASEDRSLYFFKSQRYGLAFSKTFNFRHILLLNLDYTNQELEFTRKEYVSIYGLSISYRYRFK